jgi:membrane protein
MAVLMDRLPHVRVAGTDYTTVAKETIREVGDDDVPGLAAEMAYHSILAIFPFLLFLAGVTSIIDNVFSVGDMTDRIIDKAGQVMPEDAQSVLRGFTDEVVNSDGSFAIVVGLLGSLWAASGAVGSAMKALNRAYDVKEDRGFVRRKLIAVGITVLFFGLLLTATVLVATGQFMAGGIGNALGWERPFTLMYNALSLPAAVLVVGLAVATLYALAPNTEHQWRWVSPGAVLFIVAWTLGSLIFAYYVSRFGGYNRTYGSIGAVILLLVWLYWTNFILLVGGELNAVIAAREDEAYKREPKRRERAEGSPANPSSE